mmetsp:Transcript_32494/g.68166  ORF Transcript_32494/g.68166 Transcript_32494/m.68166 type:complete len:228 (+) Transcript_32494:134-817(+)
MMAFFPTSGSNSAAVIGNPMSRSIKKPPRRQSHDRKLLAHLFSAILLSVFGIIGYYQYFAANNHDAAAVVGEDEESRQKYLNRRAGLARKRWEEQGLPSQQQHSKRQSLSNGGSPKHRLRTASIDTVIRYLTELAELPPSKLWDVLGMDDDDNDKNDEGQTELREPSDRRQTKVSLIAQIENPQEEEARKNDSNAGRQSCQSRQKPSQENQNDGGCQVEDGGEREWW